MQVSEAAHWLASDSTRQPSASSRHSTMRSGPVAQERAPSSVQRVLPRQGSAPLVSPLVVPEVSVVASPVVSPTVSPGAVEPSPSSQAINANEEATLRIKANRKRCILVILRGLRVCKRSAQAIPIVRLIRPTDMHSRGARSGARGLSIFFVL